MDARKESQVPWFEENFTSQVTSAPEMVEKPNEIGTIVIFVISAILTITLLFGVAIYIDCRQGKLERKERPKKRLIKLTLPKMVSRQVRDDEHSIIDKLEDPQPSTSTTNHIV